MVEKKNITGSREFAESIINTVRESLIVLDHDKVDPLVKTFFS